MPPGLIADDEMLRLLHMYNLWWMQKPIPASRLKPFKRQGYDDIIKKPQHRIHYGSSGRKTRWQNHDLIPDSQTSA